MIFIGKVRWVSSFFFALLMVHIAYAADVVVRAECATVYIADVYKGDNMNGVRRGSVKFLRVVECVKSVAQCVGGEVVSSSNVLFPAMNFSGENCKSDLGLVPVEADGSVYFKIPSGKNIYLQACDSSGRMIQSMRGVFSAKSGDCVSLDFDSGLCKVSEATSFESGVKTLAVSHAPSDIVAGKLSGRALSFARDIQPIFDNHCTECHDFDGDASSAIILAGDRGLIFRASYLNLLNKKDIAVLDGASSVDVSRKANSWGARKSVMLRMVEDGHGDSEITPEEIRALALWIDLNAPYYSSVGCDFPKNPLGRSPLNSSEMSELFKLCGVPLSFSVEDDLATFLKKYPVEIISFDRPEFSEILKGAKTLEDKNSALKIIRSGAERLKKVRR